MPSLSAGSGSDNWPNDANVVFRPGGRRSRGDFGYEARHLRLARPAASDARPDPLRARHAPLAAFMSARIAPSEREATMGTVQPGDMDVCSPSAATPFLDRQHSHDVVQSHQPPVTERHHANVGSSHNVFLTHVHIVANACSIQRYRRQRVQRLPAGRQRHMPPERGPSRPPPHPAALPPRAGVSRT